MSAADEIIVEIDGGDVAPENVDAPKLLNMASAYLTLLQRIAQGSGVELETTGLEIRDKCVAIVTRTNNISVAEACTRDIVSFLKEAVDPPRGYRDETRRLRDALRDLPGDQSARILGGGSWRFDLNSPNTGDAPANERWSICAILERIGGEKPARATLRSDLDDMTFSLRTSKEMIRSLAPYIYQPLDIEAEITCDHSGRIRGKLLSFQPIDESHADDIVSDWRRWHKHNSSDLDSMSIEELEVELGHTQD